MLSTGPDAVSYFRAKLRCEMSWIREYGHLENWSGSHQMGANHSPEEHITDYEFLDCIAEDLIDFEPELMTPTLSHPDLSAANIILSKLRPIELSGIIDWQGACICPGFEHFSLPPIFRLPVDGLQLVVFIPEEPALGLPKTVDPTKFSEDEKRLYEIESRWVSTIIIYSEQVNEEGGTRALNDAIICPPPVLKTMRTLIGYSTRSYEEGLVTLRKRIFENFLEHYRLPANRNQEALLIESIATKDDKAIFLEELPNRLMSEVIHRLALKGIQLSTEGGVDPEHYEEACKEAEAYLSDQLKTVANSPESIVVIEQAWPFRDGKWSPTAERCNLNQPRVIGE